MEKEAAKLKNDFKTKADQLKQKNKDLDSTKTRLDKSMKEITACKENFNTKINNPQAVRHFWQVLYTLCIVTETSWKISDIGSDNFQMISVIFHMMFGK